MEPAAGLTVKDQEITVPPERDAVSGKFTKGNQAAKGKGSHNDLRARVRDFMQTAIKCPVKRGRKSDPAAPADPEFTTRLNELLMSLYKIATALQPQRHAGRQVAVRARMGRRRSRRGDDRGYPEGRGANPSNHRAADRELPDPPAPASAKEAQLRSRRV